MAEPIGPGDWVECIDVAPLPGYAAQRIETLRQLQLGALYRVRGLGQCSRGLAYSLFLEGIRASYEHRGFGWSAHRFRPIYRPKADLIESLKAPPKRARVRKIAEVA